MRLLRLKSMRFTHGALSKRTQKPVKIFCQMEQCNFSTNKIEWAERFPFVGKIGENFPPNGTIVFFRKQIAYTPNQRHSINQGAWH